MTDALRLFMTFKSLVGGDREVEPRIAEPEFKPFRFPGRAAAAPSRVAAANVAREPGTLEELGVPGPLARELELTLRAMGMAEGDRVPGWTFTKPDGTRYALRLATEPRRGADDLAAA